MTFLSRDDIRDIYNKSAANIENSADTRETLALLSQALGELRDAGIDVSLNVAPYPSALAFTLSKGKQSSIPVTGTIETGGMQLYFAIIIANDKKPCREVALSSYDIRIESGQSKLRSEIHDFSSAEGIMAFQTRIIDRAARMDAIEKIDAKNGNMLGQGKLRKSPLRGDTP